MKKKIKTLVCLCMFSIYVVTIVFTATSAALPIWEGSFHEYSYYNASGELIRGMECRQEPVEMFRDCRPVGLKTEFGKQN